MQIYYFLPIVLIAVAVGYSMYMRKHALAQAANMSPEEAARKFQEFYGQYFELSPGQQLMGVWSGLEFHAPKSMEQKVGSVASELALNVVGVSTYVPTVHIGLLSTGEVLVSREHSEMGRRGNYKQILSLGAGTRALNAAAAHPGADVGKPPQNPFNLMVAPEFVELRAPDGQSYDAWLSPQGAQVGVAGFSSILQRLG